MEQKLQCPRKSSFLIVHIFLVHFVTMDGMFSGKIP